MSAIVDKTSKVIVITGAAGFLGQFFVRALREAGHVVVATDVALNDGDGVDAVLDVTDQDSVDTGLAQVVAEHGGIDVVINNAAIDPKMDEGEEAAGQHNRQFVNYPEEAMRQSVDVNLLGTWRVCKAAVRTMQDSGGHIINIASLYGVTPPRPEVYAEGTEKPVDYGMTKAGVIMLTRQIASQFGRDGIRCNALAPGGVFREHDEAFVERYAAETSLGRMNTPEEIADALVWLVSDGARGMTGQVLTVDAGWSGR